MNKIRNIKVFMIIAIVAVGVILTAKATLGQASPPAQHQHYYGCEHYLEDRSYDAHEHYYGCGHDPANRNSSRHWNNSRNYSGQHNGSWGNGRWMNQRYYRGTTPAHAPASNASYDPAPHNGVHYYGCGCGGWNGYYQDGMYSNGGWGCW